MADLKYNPVDLWLVERILGADVFTIRMKLLRLLVRVNFDKPKS